MAATRAPLPSLAAVEAWLNLLAETTSAGVFAYRERVLYADPACSQISGYSREELFALDPEELLAPGEKLPRSGRGFKGRRTVRFRHKNGEVRRAEVTCRRMELADGPAVVGTVRAPVDRQGAGAPQTESEDWFRTLAETTSTAIFVYRDRFLYGNRAFSELCGHSLEELLTMDPLEVVHPDFRSLVEARKLARLKGEPVPRRYEMLIITREGEERWVDYSAGRIEFDGQTAALGTAVDITDRKQAEIALRQSEERLHLAQRAAGAVAWDWNLLTDELVLSGGAGEVLEIGGVPLPGTSRDFLQRCIHPEDHDRVLAAVREVTKGGKDYSVEHRFRLPDGREGWLAERGRAIRDESGWVVRMVGVSINITERKEAEIALRESNQRLRVMIEQMPAVLWTTDRELRFTSSVGAGLAALGLQPNQVAGKSLAEYFGTDSPDFWPLRAHHRALEGESVSYEQHWADNVYQAHVEPLRDSGGRIAGTIGIALDVTGHRRAEEALARERERSQATLASLGEGVIRTDARGIVDYLNPVAERLTGFSTEEARGRPLAEVYRVVNEVTRQPAEEPVTRCLAENRPVMPPGERVLVSGDGGELSVRDSAAPIRSQDGEPVGAVLVFSDVTAVRDMEREMTYLASHDRLTGLLNRAELERRLGRALEHLVEQRRPCALLQVDLAQFKVVNDTCGHLAGDEMLKRVARLLRSRLSSQHAVARLGADEFALLLNDCPLPEARGIAEELRAGFEGYRFSWQDRSFEVGVCIGLASARADHSVTDLMIAADTACLLAKESGRNRIHEYQPDDEALAARYREMHWIHRIYKAHEEGRFRLYCQPVQPLRKGGEEGLMGEVLIRMVGEDGKLILPRTFVPAAERYRLVSFIDRWVVRQSLELLAGGAAVGGRRLDRLAINLSGDSLADETFFEFVVGQLEAHRVEAEKILFEITETAAIANLTGALRFISELKERGARFVLDDFGSGLSSFAYLKNLPVDYLKIAGEFVRGVKDVPIHRTLVRSINQIGHDLGLETIAEEVEDEETLRVVEELQLDYAQGYWIARPEPLERA